MTLQEIFERNPDLLEFCQKTGIEQQIQAAYTNFQNGIIDQREWEEFVTEIISKTSFPSHLQANSLSPEAPLIIGNGDILSRDQGLQLAQELGLDGVMIGRGVFHNPWVFHPEVKDLGNGHLQWTDGRSITVQDRIKLLMYHLQLWIETWSENKNFPVMKKYFKIYIQGFDGASQIREQLMKMETPQEVMEFLKTL